MYKIGKNSKIKANNIDIDDSVIIGDNVCSDTLKLSLIVNNSNDSLLGIIKY